MRTTLATLLLVLAGATTLVAQDPEAMPSGNEMEMRVTQAVTATGVQDREPVGIAETFSAEVGEVFFYTVFEGDFPESEVTHVWRRDGEEMARVPLTVRGPRWRTWSSKRILADWTGSWTAQVVGPEGTVIESVEFTVEAVPTVSR